VHSIPFWDRQAYLIFVLFYINFRVVKRERFIYSFFGIHVMGLRERIGDLVSKGLKRVKSALPGHLKEIESGLEQRLMLLEKRNFPAKEDVDFLLGNQEYYDKVQDPHVFNKIMLQFATYLVNAQPSMIHPVIDIVMSGAVVKMKEKFTQEIASAMNAFLTASCYCLFGDDEKIGADTVLKHFAAINSNKQYLRWEDVNENILGGIDYQFQQLEYVLGTEGENNSALNLARKIRTELQCFDILVPNYAPFNQHIQNTYQNSYVLVNSDKL
jgi:hypothetical protein